MNYIGSKLSLLDFLEKSIETITGKHEQTFCDIFAGTGAVGARFKQCGYSVIANDLQYYSFVLNKHYIENHQLLDFSNLTDEIPALQYTKIDDKPKIVCEYLLQIAPRRGFIFNNYAAGSGSDRLYFSDSNAMKCDAVRMQIEDWHIVQKINDGEYYFLIASLLENIDKYANTASVYGAFLKKLKSSAQRVFELLPAKLYFNDRTHTVYNRDANELIREIKTDILYLDPPYNHRQYATNYHLLETIARYDEPTIHGKTGLRDYSDQKSDYCSRSNVRAAFADLIANANAKYIFLSYNNEGLLTLNDIREIMSERGEYGFFTQDYNRFKADNSREYAASRTTEYLHWCKVSNQND